MATATLPRHEIGPGRFLTEEVLVFLGGILIIIAATVIVEALRQRADPTRDLVAAGEGLIGIRPTPGATRPAHEFNRDMNLGLYIFSSQQQSPPQR